MFKEPKNVSVFNLFCVIGWRWWEMVRKVDSCSLEKFELMGVVCHMDGDWLNVILLNLLWKLSCNSCHQCITRNNFEIGNWHVPFERLQELWTTSTKQKRLLTFLEMLVNKFLSMHEKTKFCKVMF
jgi:hypothetical protein